MLSYQIQSILLALMSLVAGVYSAGSAALAGGESRPPQLTTANEFGAYVGPITSANLELNSSATRVVNPIPVVRDVVLEGDPTRHAGFLPSPLLPVSRAETHSLEDTGESRPDAADYLSQIGFGSEYGSSSPVLHRWQESVRIKVHGEPTDVDMATLHQVTRELNSLISGPTLAISDADPNIDIHFLPESSFTQVDPQYVPVNLGFFRVWWDDQGVINRGRILIATQGLSQTERSHLIREELTQSLGLFMDSWEYPDSIFYQGWTSTLEYSDLDREIIRLLYSPRLKPGMIRTQLRSALTAD